MLNFFRVFTKFRMSQSNSSAAHHGKHGLVSLRVAELVKNERNFLLLGLLGFSQQFYVKFVIIIVSLGFWHSEYFWNCVLKSCRRHLLGLRLHFFLPPAFFGDIWDGGSDGSGKHQRHCHLLLLLLLLLLLPLLDFPLHRFIGDDYLNFHAF